MTQEQPYFEYRIRYSMICELHLRLAQFADTLTIRAGEVAKERRLMNRKRRLRSLQQTPKDSGTEASVESTAKRPMLSVQTETSFDADSDLKSQTPFNREKETSPGYRRFKAQDLYMENEAGQPPPANWGVFQRTGQPLANTNDPYHSAGLSGLPEAGFGRKMPKSYRRYPPNYIPESVTLPSAGDGGGHFVCHDFSDTSDSPEKLIPYIGSGQLDPRLVDGNFDTCNRQQPYRTSLYSGGRWRRPGTSTSEDEEVDPNIPVRERPSYREYLRQRHQRPREWKAPWRKDRRSKSTGRPANNRISATIGGTMPVLNGGGPLYDSDDSILMSGLNCDKESIIYTNWKAAEQLRNEEQQQAQHGNYGSLLNNRVQSQTYYGPPSQDNTAHLKMDGDPFDTSLRGHRYLGQRSKPYSYNENGHSGRIAGHRRTYDHQPAMRTPPVKERSTNNPPGAMDPANMSASKPDLPSSPSLSILREPFHNLLIESSQQLRDSRQETGPAKRASPGLLVASQIMSWDAANVNKEDKDRENSPFTGPGTQLTVSDNSAFKPVQQNGATNGDYSCSHISQSSKSNIQTSAQDDITQMLRRNNQENDSLELVKDRRRTADISCFQEITNLPIAEATLKSLSKQRTGVAQQDRFSIRYQVAKNLKSLSEDHSRGMSGTYPSPREKGQHLEARPKRSRRSRHSRSEKDSLLAPKDMPLSQEPYRRRTLHDRVKHDSQGLSVSSADSSTSPSLSTPYTGSSVREKPAVQLTSAHETGGTHRMLTSDSTGDSISRPLVVTIADPRFFPSTASTASLSPTMRTGSLPSQRRDGPSVQPQDIYFKAPKPFVSSQLQHVGSHHGALSPATEPNYQPLSTLITRITYPSDAMSASYNAYVSQHESRQMDIFAADRNIYSDPEGTPINAAGFVGHVPAPEATASGTSTSRGHQSLRPKTKAVDSDDLSPMELTQPSPSYMGRFRDPGPSSPSAEETTSETASRATDEKYSTLWVHPSKGHPVAKADREGGMQAESEVRSTLAESTESQDAYSKGSMDLSALRDSKKALGTNKYPSSGELQRKNEDKSDLMSTSTEGEAFSFQSLAKYIPEPLKLKRQIGNRLSMQDRNEVQEPSKDSASVEDSQVAQEPEGYMESTSGKEVALIGQPYDHTAGRDTSRMDIGLHPGVADEPPWVQQFFGPAGRSVVTAQSETTFIESRSSFSSTTDHNGETVVTQSRVVNEGAFASYGVAAKDDNDRVTVISLAAGARRSWWSDRRHRLREEGNESFSSSNHTASTSSDEIQQRRANEKSSRDIGNHDPSASLNYSKETQEPLAEQNDTAQPFITEPSPSPDRFDDAMPHFEPMGLAEEDKDPSSPQLDLQPDMNKPSNLNHWPTHQMDDAKPAEEPSRLTPQQGFPETSQDDPIPIPPTGKYTHIVSAKTEFWERKLQKERAKITSPPSLRPTRPLYPPVSLATRKPAGNENSSKEDPVVPVRQFASDDRNIAQKLTSNIPKGPINDRHLDNDDSDDDSYQQLSVIEKRRIFESKAAGVNPPPEAGTALVRRNKGVPRPAVAVYATASSIAKHSGDHSSQSQDMVPLSPFRPTQHQLPGDDRSTALRPLVSDSNFPSTKRHHGHHMNGFPEESQEPYNSMTSSYPPPGHRTADTLPAVTQKSQHKVQLKLNIRSNPQQPRSKFDISQSGPTYASSGTSGTAVSLSPTGKSRLLVHEAAPGASPPSGTILKQQDYEAKILLSPRSDDSGSARQFQMPQDAGSSSQSNVTRYVNADSSDDADMSSSISIQDKSKSSEKSQVSWDARTASSNEGESKIMKKIQKSGIQVMPFGLTFPSGSSSGDTAASSSLLPKKRIAQSDQWSISCPFSGPEIPEDGIPPVASITFPSSHYDHISLTLSNTAGGDAAVSNKRLKVDATQSIISDASFDELTSPENQSQRLVIRKPTKPPSRRNTGSRNPIKLLHERQDVTTDTRDSTDDHHVPDRGHIEA